ncbi:hypothetical protein FDP41_011128 [Naegleria fowleri]|uniref:Aminoacyl-transfer RNA synthetases class-II family profile domain-containing protein n=1 Tax=Naegleria fowleri TaxID=5763 RepID=A0A6A5CC10_NAEFO|nr:uncharacterized protein FDP41_011128 [Naegleria fowleri]KAF0983150.1 hypothetical protein FDP41_011128 [Naegleria fowleri]CAG4717282.1 unnamed protein product [Naegleria fowleri]
MIEAKRKARLRQRQEETSIRDNYYQQQLFLLPTITREEITSENGSKKFGRIVSSSSSPSVVQEWTRLNSSTSSSSSSLFNENNHHDDQVVEMNHRSSSLQNLMITPLKRITITEMEHLEPSSDDDSNHYYITNSITSNFVRLQCRVHSNRGSGKLRFLILREGIHFVLATLFTMEKEMINFVKKINPESIVEVFGMVCPAEKEIAEKVITGKFKNIEIKIERIYLLSLARSLPFHVHDCMKISNTIEMPFSNNDNFLRETKISFSHQLDNRVISMRVPSQLAILKIQSSITKYFRQFMEQLEFVEVHTPKLIECQKSSQGNNFQVEYFNSNAFLTSSTRHYLQMAIQGDLMKVYEVGPVFRADAGTTCRHLTQFTSLDFEMVIHSHYFEVIQVVDKLLNSILTSLENEMSQELALVRHEYSHSNSSSNEQNTPLELDHMDETMFAHSFSFTPSMDVNNDHQGLVPCLLLSYREALSLLNNHLQELHHDQNQPNWYWKREILPEEGLSTHDMQILSQIIRDTYHIDLFILNEFPFCLKSSHVMNSSNESVSNDSSWSHSFEIYLRGECIGRGHQGVHDFEMLKEYEKNGMNYFNFDFLKYGAWPHAGCSFGLERLAMAYLGLGNIRRASLFPRDSHRQTP